MVLRCETAPCCCAYSLAYGRSSTGQRGSINICISALLAYCVLRTFRPQFNHLFPISKRQESSIILLEAHTSAMSSTLSYQICQQLFTWLYDDAEAPSSTPTLQHRRAKSHPAPYLDIDTSARPSSSASATRYGAITSRSPSPARHSRSSSASTVTRTSQDSTAFVDLLAESIADLVSNRGSIDSER
ncbi:hypothetical protein EJ04DRAFT_149349 [Polyplosphaeria fusca]|uniref:Uncharacterized protein n=1 Tax=Polyplosphaeria fusca TaxID=682080 RepID=A0A9P4QZH3_9PLEO|nr:hypothetical protein EJ04DRAFT_149349 [Polyplosphaeria fusca]